METKAFFHRYGHGLVTLLYNVKHHLLVKKQDFTVVITGYPGVGKSHLGMHIFELWKRVIQKEELVEADIKYIKGTKFEWLKNFKILKPGDMTVNDEAADGLTSREAMKRFGRDIQKLYNVNRKKRIFTILILPDYFDLPLYFRKRLRGCIFVNKQGKFKFFSKYGLKFLNAYNENRNLKSMDLAYPLFVGSYPEYKGVLREAYDAQAEEVADQILDEIIRDNVSESMDDYKQLKTKEIVKLRDDGKSYDDIVKITGVSKPTVMKYYKEHIAYESQINQIE